LTLKASLCFGSMALTTNNLKSEINNPKSIILSSMQTYKTYYKSPLGPIEIIGSQDSIIALDFVEEMLPEDGELTFCVKECLKQIDEYFRRQTHCQPGGWQRQREESDCHYCPLSSGHRQ